MTRYRRRDLLERHTWRTGLSVTPELAESAALAVCRLAPGHARDLLEICGLIHRDGPAKVDVRVSQPRPGAAPKRDAHRKRPKL